MKPPILEVCHLNKTIGKKQLLRDVSFEVFPGEVYGFLGPNGAGKTTTMKCILGLLSPESGNIRLFWQENLTKEIRKKIGFMPENTYLYKYLTGEEFLSFNAQFFGYAGDILEKKITTTLEKVGMTDARKKYLHTYSKGMLQRIGLAQAIIHEPKILFLDEPMSGLDPIGRKMVKDILIDLQKSGTTLFFNTHILADVESICDKVSIIHHGKIIVQNKKLSEIEERLEDFFIREVQSV